MQQKHASKRLLALLLTMIMLLGSVTTMAWANEEDDGPYEPIIDYLDMQHYSPEPRPAEAFSLSLELFGRPTNGYAFTAGGFSTELTFVDPGSYAVLHQETVTAKSLELKGEDYYVATVEVDASAWPNSRMIVGKVIINDGSAFIWEEETNWEFDIAEGYSADISITNMRTDKNVVELSDANYDPVNGVIPETVKLTMELDVPAGFTIPTAGYDILFEIENDNEDFHSEHEVYGGVLSTDSNGKTYAEWTMDIGYFWGEGNYTINWVKYHDFSADPVYLSMNGNNIALRVDRSKISDKSAPAITDFYFSLNGVKQTEGGFRVKQTDTVKFHIAATDPAYIQDNTVGLMSDLFGECNLQATYDSAKGELICNVPVAHIDATEWYMNYFHAADIYENIDAFSLGDDDDFAEMKHLYFFLEDANGECPVNTYDATLCFHTNRLIEYEDGSGEREVVEISLTDLPRIYSLSEVLGSRMPTAAIPVDGLTFEGWYCPDTIQSYFTAADDTMFGEYSYVDLYPVYDQAWIEVVCSFINQDAARIYSSPVMDVLVPHGSTVQDVIDAFEAAGGVDHELYPGSVLSEWLCNDALDMVITPHTTGISLEPVYEKFPVFVSYAYMNADGLYEYAETEKTVFMTKGDTLADVIEAAGLNDLDHYEDLPPLYWASDGMSLSDEIGWDFEWASFEAVYEKLPVNVSYGYWNENGEAVFEDAKIYLKFGGTYQDLMDAFTAYAGTLKHWDKAGFTGWENANGMNPDYPVTFPIEGELVYIAQYNTALPNNWDERTHISMSFYDENLEHRMDTVYFDDTQDLTYRQMIAKAVQKAQHSSQLKVLDWKVTNFWDEPIADDFLDQKAQPAHVGILLTPVYDKAVVMVNYSYINTKGETKNVSNPVAVPFDTTYQQVIDQLQHPTDISKDCGFVEWIYPGTTLTDKVAPEWAWIQPQAVYKKYPVTYSYSYINAKGETVCVNDTVLLDAGTKLTAYIDNLTGVKHSPDLTFKRWVFEQDVYGLDGEVYLWTSGVSLMAEYEETTPVCIDIEQLNNDLDYDRSILVCYANGTTANSSLEDLLAQIIPTVEKSLITPKDFEITDVEEWFRDYLTPGNSSYEVGLAYGIRIIYDKAVLELFYPDETSTKVVVENESDYLLPTTYNGKAIGWYENNGDGTITAWGPYYSIDSYYLPETAEAPAEMTGNAVDEAVKDVTSAVESGKKEVTVSMTDKNTGVTATVVPTEVLEAAKGKNVNVVLDMGDYSWTIKGKDIDADKIQTINLGVEVGTNAIPEEAVNTVANKNGKKNPTVQISLAHEGEFGFKADLKVYVGTEYAGQYANLYYHNVKANGKLDFQHAVKVDKDGYAIFNFNHASDYVVVMDEADHTVTPEPEKPEVTPEPEKPEVTPEPEKPEVTPEPEKPAAPATGDSFPMVSLIVAALVSAAGIFLLSRKSKRA